MQNDERDVLAILEFDLREETIGIWLRCIMQRLEEKRRAIGVTSGVDQALDVTRAELVAGGRRGRWSLIRNDLRKDLPQLFIEAMNRFQARPPTGERTQRLTPKEVLIDLQ